MMYYSAALLVPAPSRSQGTSFYSQEEERNIQRAVAFWHWYGRQRYLVNGTESPPHRNAGFYIFISYALGLVKMTEVTSRLQLISSY
jgi:hypothetical protein